MSKRAIPGAEPISTGRDQLLDRTFGAYLRREIRAVGALPPDATGRVICPRCGRADVEVDADGRMAEHKEVQATAFGEVLWHCSASGKRPGDAL